MSPVPGGSADSLAAGGVVETRGGQLDNPRGDVSSPSAKHLRCVIGRYLLWPVTTAQKSETAVVLELENMRPSTYPAVWLGVFVALSNTQHPDHPPTPGKPSTTLDCSTSTAPSLPPAGRLGSLSSADLCAVAAPQPRPTLDIARLDPTTSLHSNGGGGGGNGNGSHGNGNGNGSNGGGSVHGGQALGRNGDGNGNGDTARSGQPGAAGASGLWGAGSGGGSGGAGDGACRLPPVSEAAVLATAAAETAPARQAQLQKADTASVQQPDVDAARTPRQGPAAVALSAGGGSTLQGSRSSVRADGQQHSSSGGSSNSPDEGHRQHTGALRDEQCLSHRCSR